MAWEPMAITSKDAVDVEGDQVQVVWSLDRNPEADWVREFRRASLDHGVAFDFPRIPSPDVRLGGSIHWTVPAADLRAAVEHVKACVADANTAYAGVLARRHEERRRRAAEEAAKAERLRAAQQALNAMD